MEAVGLNNMVFIVAAGFVAAFIDSVVGGGGLISLPALMITGLPPVVVLGTNKMAAVMGSLTSVISFLRSGKIDLRLIRYLFPLALVGSALGVYVVRLIPPHFLKPLLICLLVVVFIYTVFKKDFGDISTYSGISGRKGLLVGTLVFIIGFYDGFFGPGTGSFLLFGFLLLGFDFVSAAGNARALNFASNLSAVAVFAACGLINYHYSIPMGLAMIAGAWLGSRVAIRQGARYVKPLFLAITGLLVGKQLWEIFFR